MKLGSVLFLGLSIPMISIGVAYGIGLRLNKMASNSSMYPTLKRGDLFITKKINPDCLINGDLIIIRDGFLRTNNPLTKRVIGISGDTITINNDSLFINHEFKPEPYRFSNSKPAKRISGEWVIGIGKLFVMGDNRDKSFDSRDQAFGLVGYEYVAGKIIAIL